MPVPDIDLTSLSVDERLQLIEVLWESIEKSASDGDSRASQVMQSWSDLDPDFVAELEREADEAEKDPASQTSWEGLLAELKQKQR